MIVGNRRRLATIKLLPMPHGDSFLSKQDTGSGRLEGERLYIPDLDIIDIIDVCLDNEPANRRIWRLAGQSLPATRTA